MYPTTKRDSHRQVYFRYFRIKKENADQTVQIHRLICNKEHIFSIYLLYGTRLCSITYHLAFYSLVLKFQINLAESQEYLFSGLWTRSDTKRAVQPQKMARGLKF